MMHTEYGAHSFVPPVEAPTSSSDMAAHGEVAQSSDGAALPASVVSGKPMLAATPRMWTCTNCKRVNPWYQKQMNECECGTWPSVNQMEANGYARIPLAVAQRDEADGDEDSALCEHCELRFSFGELVTVGDHYFCAECFRLGVECGEIRAPLAEPSSEPRTRVCEFCKATIVIYSIHDPRIHTEPPMLHGVGYCVPGPIPPHAGAPAPQSATPPRVRYVCGFALQSGDVLLIEKQRPEWQRGRWNGVGGRIEQGESDADAMRREFREETGADVEGWEHFATMQTDHGTEVVFFRVKLHDVLTIRRTTDEAPGWWPVKSLPAVIPNLLWLVPMAQHESAEHGMPFRIEEAKAPAAAELTALRSSLAASSGVVDAARTVEDAARVFLQYLGYATPQEIRRAIDFDGHPDDNMVTRTLRESHKALRASLSPSEPRGQ